MCEACSVSPVGDTFASTACIYTHDSWCIYTHEIYIDVKQFDSIHIHTAVHKNKWTIDIWDSERCHNKITGGADYALEE